MRTEQVVVNASPLIVLFKGGLSDILPQLFATIFVPEAVWDEVIAGGATDAAAQQLPTVTWAQRIRVAVDNPIITSWNLGAGESEVVSFALKHAGVRAMVDDAAARSCARTLGVPVLGTGGALVLAKRRGVVPSVEDSIRKLRDAGLWISDNIAELLLRQAGER